MVALDEQSTGMELTFPLPIPNNRLFRYTATGDVLSLLANNPHTRFSIRDIRRATDRDILPVVNDGASPSRGIPAGGSQQGFRTHTP